MPAHQEATRDRSYRAVDSLSDNIKKSIIFMLKQTRTSRSQH